MDYFGFFKKIGFLLFIIALIWGAWLRIYNLGEAPYWMDEGSTINAVLQIEKTGSPILNSGYYYNCNAYCYPTAIISSILGNTAFNFRILSAIFGILTILIIYELGKNFFSRNVAIFSSLLLSFSYWQIAWSRQARWYTEITFFFWVSVYFFFKYFFETEKNKKYFYLSAVSSVIAMTIHPIGYILPIILAVLTILKNKKTTDENSRNIIKSEMIFSSAISVVAIVLLYPYAKDFLSSVDFSYTLPYYLSFYLKNYWILILLSLFAIFNPESKFKKQTYFAGGIGLLSVTPFFFFTDIVNYRYLFHATPVFFLLGSLGAVELSSKIKGLAKLFPFIIIFIILFFTRQLALLPETNYFLESDNIEDIKNRPSYVYTPQPNFNKAYEIIKSKKDKEDVVISSHPQFNAIFLNQPGYWLEYSEIGKKKKITEYKNREIYTGAETIPSLEKFIEITDKNHGFVVFDFMSINGRIDEKIIDYIVKNMSLAFYDERNAFSRIWVYEF